MNGLKILCLAGCIMKAGCCTVVAVEFAEFKVTVVSQPTLLVDSVSSRKCNRWLFGGYFKASIGITGELDGCAKITYGADSSAGMLLYASKKGLRPSDKRLYTLEKGKINDTIQEDHYYYKLWIKIVPIDCRKGHLKISTKII